MNRLRIQRLRRAGMRGLGALSTSQSSIAQMVIASADKYGVPPSLALGIANHESGFNPSATNHNTNGTTDWGVMQLNDTTVQTLGVSNPLDPQQNIDAGVSLLGKYLQQYNGDTTKALWAYASGPGAVANGSMNPTATQFIGYVQNYSPDPSLDISSSFSPSTFDPGTSTTPTTNPFTGLPDSSSSLPLDSSLSSSFSSVNWLVVGIIGLGALAFLEISD